MLLKFINYKPLYTFTKQYIPTVYWRANSRYTNQGIFSRLLHPAFHHRRRQDTLHLDPILSQKRSVQILPSAFRSSKLILPFIFLRQNLVESFFCHMHATHTHTHTHTHTQTHTHTHIYIYILRNLLSFILSC